VWPSCWPSVFRLGVDFTLRPAGLIEWSPVRRMCIFWMNPPHSSIPSNVSLLRRSSSDSYCMLREPRLSSSTTSSWRPTSPIASWCSKGHPLSQLRQHRKYHLLKQPMFALNVVHQASIVADWYEPVPGISRDHLPTRSYKLPTSSQQGREYEGPGAEG
jgi:hypothetical protein